MLWQQQLKGEENAAADVRLVSVWQMRLHKTCFSFLFFGPCGKQLFCIMCLKSDFENTQMPLVSVTTTVIRTNSNVELNMQSWLRRSCRVNKSFHPVGQRSSIEDCTVRRPLTVQEGFMRGGRQEQTNASTGLL